MAILKKLVEFIRMKLGTAIKNNTTLEDQYTSAAQKFIDKIAELQTVHVKSVGEERRLNSLADEKDRLAESREKEIKRLIAQGTDVTTHAKLGLLYRRTAKILREKADAQQGIRDEIEKTVVSLDDRRLDLKVKLEYIRETRSANEMGIATAEDVVEIAKLTEINVDKTLMEIETFTSADPSTETTQADVNEYIASLK